MAYLTATTCIECGGGFMGDVLRGLTTCKKCVKLADDKKEAAHYARLDKMTVEERLRELEKISYKRSITPLRYIPPLGSNT